MRDSRYLDRLSVVQRLRIDRSISELVKILAVRSEEEGEAAIRSISEPWVARKVRRMLTAARQNARGPQHGHSGH